MQSSLLELLPLLAELAFFGLSSLGLTVAGAYIERFAFTTIRSGSVELGAVTGLMGLVVLGFGYLVATDQFVPRLGEFRRGPTDDADRNA